LAADESASSRSAAIRAGLLLDNRHLRLIEEGNDGQASLPDQAGLSLDEDAPDISTARLEQALERLAHEAEQRRRGLDIDKLPDKAGRSAQTTSLDEMIEARNGAAEKVLAA
jgi:hypothetical protein